MHERVDGGISAAVFVTKIQNTKNTVRGEGGRGNVYQAPGFLDIGHTKRAAPPGYGNVSEVQPNDT